MPITLEAPELRVSKETRHALYARTKTGIVIGGSWLRKQTPQEATAMTGPHRRESKWTQLGDRVLYRLALPLSAVVAFALLAAERFT